MGSRLKLRGLFVPLVTPFDESGKVDVAALEALASGVLDAGATGLVALATTGEATSLDAAERDVVVRVCSELAIDRGAPLIVGAGTYNTRVTIERHEALAEVPGVVASLAVVPYYVRPSEAGIVAHFEAVAARSPVPLVIYNIPYRTGRGLGAASLLELASVDNIVGLKQAVGGIDTDTLTVLANCPQDFAVMGGDDPFLFLVAAMGGAGAISAAAHVCTRRFSAMIEGALAGEFERGRREAEALLSLTLALLAEPSPAVIKAVLHAQGRLPTAAVRMPLAKASSSATSHALDLANCLDS